MKVYSPSLIQALADALLASFWFKGDLRSFLIRAGVPSPLVAQLDWSREAPKRTTLRALFDHLAAKADQGTPIVSKLIDSVVEQDNFDHLVKLDDGARRASDARAAVSRLKDLLGAKNTTERAERARAEHRTAAEQRKVDIVAREADQQALWAEFGRLHTMGDERARGLAFEPFLRKLFALHDLDPRGAFTAPGEQTDGSLRLDGTLFLVEARWRKDRAEPTDLSAFRGKIEHKLDNTLGLFISMNGFTDEAVRHAGLGGRCVLVLVDGQDLVPAIQGHIDLAEMLRRKVRRASDKGEFLARV